MVVMYNIMGRQVGSHVLAMVTLGSAFAIPFLIPGGGSKKTSTPPTNSSSKDEEKFIQEFLQQAEQNDKASKISGKEAH